MLHRASMVKTKQRWSLGKRVMWLGFLVSGHLTCIACSVRVCTLLCSVFHLRELYEDDTMPAMTKCAYSAQGQTTARAAPHCGTFKLCVRRSTRRG